MKVNIFVFLCLLNIISGCIDFSVNVKLSFFPYVCIKFHCVWTTFLLVVCLLMDNQAGSIACEQWSSKHGCTSISVSFFFTRSCCVARWPQTPCVDQTSVRLQQPFSFSINTQHTPFPSAVLPSSGRINLGTMPLI